MLFRASALTSALRILADVVGPILANFDHPILVVVGPIVRESVESCSTLGAVLDADRKTMTAGRTASRQRDPALTAEVRTGDHICAATRAMHDDLAEGIANPDASRGRLLRSSNGCRNYVGRSAKRATTVRIGVVAGGWSVLPECPLLRLGKRIDTSILAPGVVGLVEFKIGATSYDSAAGTQTERYAQSSRPIEFRARDGVAGSSAHQLGHIPKCDCD